MGGWLAYLLIHKNKNQVYSSVALKIRYKLAIPIEAAATKKLALTNVESSQNNINYDRELNHLCIGSLILTSTAPLTILSAIFWTTNNNMHVIWFVVFIEL